MWLCFNDGFVSVVEDRNDPARLLVRARRQADLVGVVGPDAEIVETPEADYRWRTFVTREQLKQIVSARIDGITYPNFKNSVKNHALHELYSDFWSLHYQYGHSDPALRKSKAVKDRPNERRAGD